MVDGTHHGSRAGYGDVARVVCATILIGLATCGVAHASHFRYGSVTWARQGTTRTVDFTIQGVWRRDAYGNSGTGASARCVTKTNPPVNTNCTGAGGFAGVGDAIHETVGTSTFDFGDGSSTFGATVGSNKALVYLVTSVDPTNNWLFGLALDHRSLPTIDTTIDHTYSGTTTTFAAKIENCCRISPCTTPNAHLNNPDNGYSVSTTVDLTSGISTSSPVTSLPPIILCPQNGLCNFNVPVSDNEGNAVTYRLATKTEMHADFFNSGGQQGLGEPGEGMATCADATIAAATGDYAWNTAMCRLAGSPTPQPPVGGCNNSSLHTLYSSQVIIEENAPRLAKSAVDFLIELVPACNLNTHTPTFDAPTPVCGSTQSANPGHALNFSVSSSDVDASDPTTLNAVGLPAGATMTPGLPATANPVISSFSWTPTGADVGQHLMTFTATDSCGHQALCAITIDVSQENCTDGIDNDGDGLADCADPDCDGTPCSDGQFCTVNDSCQNGTCTSGPARDCTDTNDCTADSCNEAADQCVHNPAPLNGTSCDDGLFCTDGDVCTNGSCGGAPRDCSDANACTADSCDEGTDQCVHDAAPLNGSGCDDGQFCTVGDQCSNGTCAGTARDCADTSACTVDGCNEALDQCIHDPAPLQGTGCDDGQFCTVGDVCNNGTCAGAPRDCADTNACTADTCNEAIDQCVHDAAPLNGSGCDDGQFCTVGDLCSNGTCGGTPRNCADTSACTVDGCNEALDQCIHDPAPLQGTGCDDGQFCTVGDVCNNGTCAGAPRDCADTNACTADSCNEAADQCVHNPAPLNGTSCDDGLFCTDGDVCTNGSCGGAPRDCADTNGCTADSCNEGEAQCVHDPVPLNGSSCDDAQYCTVGDVCASGTCTGTARDCADANACTADSCNEASDQCVHDPAPLQGSGCDDGQFCTVADTCSNGTCVGTARNCADSSACTTDACDETGAQCTHTPIEEGGACDDGLFCTVNEVCSSGSCGGGTPRNCADGSDCTADSCDEAADRCVNDPAPYEGTPCSDGNACTEGDHCAAGSCVAAPLDCSDDIPCTVDTCDKVTGCQHRQGPGAGCLMPQRSILVVRESTTPAKNKVVWKWLKGPADISGYGDPSVDTEYAFCVYDQSNGGAVSRLAMQSIVPAGTVWRKLGGGSHIMFRYKESDATGQRKVLLKSLANNTGRIGFKSKGDKTTPPEPVGATLFDDDGAVVVQLISSAGKCWESRFATPAVKHRASVFKDKCGDLVRGPCD